MHKFGVGQVVQHKASGKPYVIDRLRSDSHPMLKGEIGYDAYAVRNGERFGASRLFPESRLVASEQRVA